MKWDGSLYNPAKMLSKSKLFSFEDLTQSFRFFINSSNSSFAMYFYLFVMGHIFYILFIFKQFRICPELAGYPKYPRICEVRKVADSYYSCLSFAFQWS